MRNAKQILQGGLKEINNDKWICGDLCQLPNGATPESGGNVSKEKDVMGCALGLVSIYGEDLESSYVMIQGIQNPNFIDFGEYGDAGNYWIVEPKGVTMLTARYADANSPKAVIKAIKALHAAMPKKSQLDLSYYEGEYLIENLNEAVYGYNDGLKDRYKTRKAQVNAARRWFEKAIELLPTVDSSLNTVATKQVKTLASAF